jgi:hypothetical protein
LNNDTLLSLDTFVDGIKASLNVMVCVHYSFAPYAKWKVDYLLTTSLCPPEIVHHPRYQAMCINYNAYGQLLHRFLHNDTAITHDSSPLSYHELTALDNISCGWKLLQECIWACSPHMSGTYSDYRALVRQLLPLANELIVTYYHRVYELSREIRMSHIATGMQHELLHCFVQTLSLNGDHGYNLNSLQSFLIQIRDIQWSPTHAQDVLPFTYHAVLVILHLTEITPFHVTSSIKSGPSGLMAQSPVLAAAKMHPQLSHQY